MTLRPLGRVKELVESVGMGISYAFEDLVFMEHNAFLLQFGDDNRSIIFHINEEADQAEVGESYAKLRKAAPLKELHLVQGKHYKLAEADDNTVKLQFFP